MQEKDKKVIKDLLDACAKSYDGVKNFKEQYEDIKEKVKINIGIFKIEVDINDPELDKMIKESIVITEKKPIVFEKGYTPWLNDYKSKIEWKCYSRYENYLVKTKKWNWGTVQSINESTDSILDHMGNPISDSFFSKKGLVMGDIQSGKTANYTALINKALDSGYKLIIVLAGLTKDLRSQTQKRLDKEVLGYETFTEVQKKGKAIGVGLEKYKGDFTINTITHSGEKGDLKKTTAESINTPLRPDMNPLIAVLKKNSAVLNAFIGEFLGNNSGDKTKDKFNVPILVIDDEVDQASVNTSKKENIEEASSINKLIRIMLAQFNRYTYVGYTATPFANVFINPFGFTKEDEKDIFPEDFIICLPRPKNYCGVKEYFGIDTLSEGDDNSAISLDLYRKIDDYYDLFDEDVRKNKKVRVDSQVININKSLHEAFMHFIIASAIKYSRGIEEHNSMLIHIARYKNPATSMRDLVKNELSKMLQEYKYGEAEDKEKYKKYWEEKIQKVSKDRLMSEYKDKWEDIEKHIIPVFEMTLNGIKIVNGDSGDVCDYNSSNVGQHIIIGGDKLSRGLTLEGLIVSYYYRKTRTYDALLQMGRWFGYRPGWIDLCRIYTINSFVNDFINAGISTEMFKKDIEDMNRMKMTPVEFGLKIRYSPRLAPTSSTKMRYAQKQKISFSSDVPQVLTYEKKYVSNNRELTDTFLGDMKCEVRKNGNCVYKNVTSDKIIEYLRNYKECDRLVGSVSIKNWINYIEKMNSKNELTDWTIILHSNSNKDNSIIDYIGGNTIYKSQYADRNLNANDNDELLYLKAIIDQTDFRDIYDEDSDEYKKVKKFELGNKTIENSFTKEKGVLALYIMDIHKKEFEKEEISEKTGKIRKKYKQGKVLEGGKGVVGLCAWFPIAGNLEDSAVDYYVNAVYQQDSIYEEEEEE